MPLTSYRAALAIRLMNVPATNLDLLVTSTSALYSLTVKLGRRTFKTVLTPLATETGGPERPVETPVTAAAFTGFLFLFLRVLAQQFDKNEYLLN